MSLREASSPKVLALPEGAADRLRVCCAGALRLEQRGEYESAVEILSPFWQLDTYPKTSGLTPDLTALLLLRAGSLMAWIGTKRQIEGAQETARDLLSESADISEAAGLTNIWLEARQRLALCYWRAGSFEEGRTIITTALEQADHSTDQALELNLTLAVIEWSEGRYREALTLLRGLAPAVEKTSSHYLKGTFHNGIALNQKHLGDRDAAIIALTASCYHLEIAGHRPYLIGAEINLANLLVETGSLNDAQQHLERAEELARELGDEVHLAHAKDSQALAYLAQRNYSAAEIAARHSVRILEKGDEAALLVDSLLTLGRALAGSSQSRESLKVYLRAYELAADRLSGERAARIGIEMIGKVSGQLCLDADLPFDEINHKFQESIFKAALDKSDGKVTQAAMRLGLSHQVFIWQLNNWYAHLRQKPARRKSIIPASAKPPTKR
jgi:tetratricopeptide (TPR) repeat protein